ncbi:hypothetical protein KSS87_007112 [Heliosperma pusillum]|nr:hypothetical protein KSS87_007112 [Heliosperma pusillum]
MERKRWREESHESSKHIMKAAAVKASVGVVSIVTHDVPEEMCQNFRGYCKMLPSKEVILFGCGMIVECLISSSNRSSSRRRSRSRKYVCKVLAPASLFQRPNHVNLNTIKIHVFSLTGVLYKPKLLGCDFHYNLAVVAFKSKSPLPTVTFKGIDDVLSIHPTAQNSSFHSDLFKILPGTPMISLSRDYFPPYTLESSTGIFSSTCPDTFGCNELYEIKDSTYDGYDGGAVLNCFGDIIGIIFNTSSFLPSNIVTRWWEHFKSTGGFRHPFLGFKIANLYDADLDFLAQFVTKFPHISAAVMVTKVEEGSPASRSGLQIRDVIVKVDGKLVKSKLKFFETIWEKDEKSVEFNVLRVTNGEEWNVSLVVEEASPDKFHQWLNPGWRRIWDSNERWDNEGNSIVAWLRAYI